MIPQSPSVLYAESIKETWRPPMNLDRLNRGLCGSLGGRALHVSVRDRTLTEAGYEAPAHGLADLELSAIEVEADPTLRLPALDGGDRAVLPIESPAGSRTYRAHLYTLGVQVSAIGLAWQAPDTDGPQQPAWVAGVIRAADVIGARVVRICLAPGRRDDERSSGSAAGLAGELEVLLGQTAGSAPMLAVEVPWQSGEGVQLCRDLLQIVVSDRLGLALDPGRLYSPRTSLDGVYGVVREFAPWVRHVSCSGWRFGGEPGDELERTGDRAARPSRLDEGDIDYARIASILGAVGYAGALTVDCEFGDGLEPAGRQQVLRSDVLHLKDILGEG